MQIKQSTSFRVPVRLVSTNTTAVSGATGVVYTQPTVYIQKQAGSSALKALSNSDWFELDATNMPGIYDMLMSTSNTDTVGFLKYTVALSGSETYIGILEIVANVVSDVYTIVNTNLDATVSSRAPSSTALSTATWTNARAGYLDTVNTNLDATVSSRAPSSTALSTATWTSGRASNLDNLDFACSKLAGLGNGNSYIDTEVYDGSGHLTSARRRVYDTAANATSHGGTGLLYTHTITATYDGSGNCTSFLITMA